MFKYISRRKMCKKVIANYVISRCGTICQDLKKNKKNEKF